MPWVFSDIRHLKYGIYSIHMIFGECMQPKMFANQIIAIVEIRIKSKWKNVINFYKHIE